MSGYRKGMKNNHLTNILTMQRILLLLFVFCRINIYSQEKINYEQFSYDYFINSIYDSSLVCKQRTKYDGVVNEKYTSFDKPNGCFNNQELFIALKLKALSNNIVIESPKIDINNNISSKVSFSKNKTLSKNKYIMSINRASIIDNYAYVMIRLDSKYRTIDYFFELDLQGNVLRWCQSGKL
jgi:hypothetical protein